MESISCSVANCQKPPRFICKCTSPPTLLCTDHQLDHLEIVETHPIQKYVPPLTQQQTQDIELARKYLNNARKVTISQELTRYSTEISHLLKDIKQKRAVSLQKLQQTKTDQAKIDKELGDILTLGVSEELKKAEVTEWVTQKIQDETLRLNFEELVYFKDYKKDSQPVQLFRLCKKALLQTRSNEFVGALGTFKDCMALAQSINWPQDAEITWNQRDVGIVMNEIGTIQLSLYNYETAILAFQKVIALESAATSERAKAFNNLGTALFFNNQTRQAIEAYKESYAIYKILGSWQKCAEIATRLGLIHNILGKHDLAIRFFYSARSYWKELTMTEQVARAAENIGITLLLKGQYEVAKNILEDSLKDLTALKLSKDEARVAHNIAYAQYKLKNLEQACIYAKYAYGIKKKAGFRVNKLHSMLLLALIHKEKREYLAAENILVRVREEFKFYFLDVTAGVATNQLGITYYAAGIISMACETFHQSVFMWKLIGAKNEVAHSKKLFSFCWQEQDLAQENLVSQMQMHPLAGNLIELYKYPLRKARKLRIANMFQEAENVLQDILPELREMGTTLLLGDVLKELGNVYCKAQSYRAAKVIYIECISIYDILDHHSKSSNVLEKLKACLRSYLRS